MEINRITGAIIDSAMKVHSAFGPGLLESAYKACLVYELRKRGFRVDVEVGLPLIYDGVKLEEVGYRLDLLVENEVVVELKAVEIMAPIFEAKLLHYLKLSGKKVGLLINFLSTSDILAQRASVRCPGTQSSSHHSSR